MGGKEGGKSCRHGQAQSRQMTEVWNQKREGIQGGQMHYREPPAAQIADMKHEVASRGNELRMTSTCVHVVYR